MDFDGCFLHFHFTPLETIRFENDGGRSEEHTSELQSQSNLVCRLLLEKKKNTCPPPLLIGDSTPPDTEAPRSAASPTTLNPSYSLHRAGTLRPYRSHSASTRSTRHTPV